MTHTLEPWVYIEQKEGLWTVRSRTKGHRVAKDLRAEDARLIAAAPELLEALRFVLLRFPCLEDKHLPYLRGIVAKATEEV